MMRSLFISLLLLPAFTLIAGVPPAPLPETESAALCRSVEEANALPISLSFTMTRHSDMLESDLKGSGTVEIPRPGLIRVQQIEPVSKLTELDAAKGGFSAPERLLDERSFKIDCFDEGSFWLLVLTPLRRDLKRLFKTVELRADKSGFHLRKIRLNEPSSGYTILEIKS